MEVTEVKVKLVDIKSERLKAFCTITLDGEFVIRDIKVIEGVTVPFVAMPSRKLAVKCPRCSTKNHLRAKFCNECGTKLPKAKFPKDNAAASNFMPISPTRSIRIRGNVSSRLCLRHTMKKWNAPRRRGMFPCTSKILKKMNSVNITVTSAPTIQAGKG